MEKILKLDIYYTENMYIGGDRNQTIIDKENDINFGVSNLTDCPEDAIIGRDLFDSDDYIRALNKGIELANKGYTKVIAGKRIKEEE